MANFYNNNNIGNIYGNQNNMYGQQGQNIYANQNQNYNRPQGNYQNNFNYNQNNNYQQQNYNNQNPQSNGPRPFISGYMGRILISSETLDAFEKSLRTVEWTNNPNYLQANDIEVKMKLSSPGQTQSDNGLPRNRFNDYNMNSNFNMNNFINFIKEVNDTNTKRKEKIENEKNNFIRNNFPGENNDISMQKLYVKIGQYIKDVVMKDNSLYRKVERLLPLLKPVQIPNNFEEDKKNDNGNMGAPQGPASEKIFTNTPGF